MRKQTCFLGRLWNDDRGAVLATEWLLITTVLVLGLIPGLIAIRQGLLAEMGDIATATSDLDQSYGFTGQEISSDSDSGDNASGNGVRGAVRFFYADPVVSRYLTAWRLSTRAASDGGRLLLPSSTYSPSIVLFRSTTAASGPLRTTTH
jgi:hypothetical protein